jgi:hypothetical protein
MTFGDPPSEKIRKIIANVPDGQKFTSSEISGKYPNRHTRPTPTEIARILKVHGYAEKINLVEWVKV